MGTDAQIDMSAKVHRPQFRVEVFYDNSGCFDSSRAFPLLVSPDATMEMLINSCLQTLDKPDTFQACCCLCTRSGMKLAEPEYIMPDEQLLFCIEHAAAPPQHLASKKIGADVVVVRLGYKIVTMLQIDTAAELMALDFILIAEWRDPALLGQDPGSIDWSSAFDPGFSIQNAQDLNFVALPGAEWDDGVAAGRRLARMQHDTDLAAATEPPLVKWTRRYRGTLAQVLRFDDYPFDRQQLEILARPRFGCDKIKLELERHWRRGEEPSMLVAGWNLISH